LLQFGNAFPGFGVESGVLAGNLGEFLRSTQRDVAWLAGTPLLILLG
jgi:hypothetical protein